MRWHEVEHLKDGKLRYLDDAQVWKDFDSLHTDLAFDPCNVRLELASDGSILLNNKHCSYHIASHVNSVQLASMDVHKAYIFMLSLIIPSP